MQRLVGQQSKRPCGVLEDCRSCTLNLTSGHSRAPSHRLH
jgi:hypothetical protein